MPLQTRPCSQDVDGENEHSVDFLDPNLMDIFLDGNIQTCLYVVL